MTAALVNDSDRPLTALYHANVRPLLALLVLLLIAAAPPVEVGPTRQCDGERCAPADLTSLRLQGREALLVRTVTVGPNALPLERPLMIRIVAMASAEVRWNGVVIGRNGVPSVDAASEAPGRFVASFIVPPELVRPGENLASARLSAHHLWLPVPRPVHLFGVGPYTSEELPGRSHYLPALLVLGALAAACVYFSVAAATDRRDRAAMLLALIASAAMLQLGAEVSRAFLAYSYPWHLARVGAVAVLAAVIAALAAAYAAQRFAPEWQRRIVLATTFAAATGLVLIPWYDLKAIAAIVGGAAGVGFAGAYGLRRRRRGASAALAAALAVLALLAWQLTGFLDQGWFVLLAAVLIALVAEQVQSLRRVRDERDAEARRAATLAERITRAEREGEPILALKEGTRTHRVAESDIVSIRAADDYCEAVLADGRILLTTVTLSRLIEALPPRFLRVHRSFAVNRAHVTGAQPKPGGGRVLHLSNGSTVPVGRSYALTVVEAFS